MGAPLQVREGLVGGPGVSYGLSWLRASLELGRSRRAAARLPFWVKAGRVSTDTDRLFNGDIEAAGLMRVVSSSRTHPLSSSLAPQKKVRDSGCEEREESQLIKEQRKVDPMRRHTPLVRGAERSGWGTHIARIGLKDNAPGGAAPPDEVEPHEEGCGLMPLPLDHNASICRWGLDGVTLPGGPSDDPAAVKKTLTPEQVRLY
ncbi:hypothetical protein NDU88_004442 [Pleurodeles waltl]|uniref:Uncharacterized protein n=1 Tax=Pleurodeles waltl TaxID=8319 RepID=A0AAV7LLD3_PLEWA|nr:hypothetical protein NDU88_004442 [Pleurodeles waltl]